MYVCACRALTDRTVRAAIASGARTIEDISQRCGAGVRCGGCWPVLRELLDEHHPADQGQPAATSAA